MAFQPSANLPDFAKLKATFVGAKDQIKNYLLFQTVINLLDSNQKMRDIFKKDIENNAGAIVDLSEEDFLTFSDESVPLPNSRNLLAGTNVTFDDTVDNERTVNVTSGAADVRDVGYWTPLIESLAPGDSELVLTDEGAPIAVWTPTP